MVPVAGQGVGQFALELGDPGGGDHEFGGEVGLLAAAVGLGEEAERGPGLVAHRLAMEQHGVVEPAAGGLERRLALGVGDRLVEPAVVVGGVAVERDRLVVVLLPTGFAKRTLGRVAGDEAGRYTPDSGEAPQSGVEPPTTPPRATLRP